VSDTAENKSKDTSSSSADAPEASDDFPHDVAECKDIRRVISHFKGQSACEFCGEDDPRCLMFFNEQSARAVNARYIDAIRRASPGRRLSAGDVHAILSKQTPVCLNCFRRHFWSDSRRYNDLQTRMRDELTAIKADAGCRHCGERDAVCLDFHHLEREKKSFAIYGAIKFASREELLAEIEICEIACSNCHSKLHAEETSDG
jgi:hypothetical protein